MKDHLSRRGPGGEGVISRNESTISVSRSLPLIMNKFLRGAAAYLHVYTVSCFFFPDI